jgi:ribosomal subunit interface protein
MSTSTAFFDEQEAGAASPAPSRMEIPWNFVTKNLVGHELLRKKLLEKISKLQRHLKNFPADAVHLNIVLERQVRRHFHTARLTLRLPSNTLHTMKSAPDVIAAFDLAVKALLRELQDLKTDLRGEAAWKRKELRKNFLMPSRAPALPGSRKAGGVP